MESNIKPPVFRSPVVLLVDDQALVANRVKDLLKTESDMVLHFCPDPAVAIAQAMQIKPTVILMDLVMPHIDGLTLCRVFRDTQETADIPIIMLSANDDGLTKAHAFNSGANDYLVKLPEAVEFVARIRYHSKNYITKLERDEAYEALCRSQTSLEEVNLRLQQMAHHDNLTKLPNRSLLIDQLSQALARAKRNKHLVAVLFLDLDEFKPINDHYGHHSGDEVLKAVAQRLLSSVRETDIVARLGGDEFVCVLSEIQDCESAAIVAQKIIQSIAIPIPLVGDRQCLLGISIGISIFPGDSCNIDRLLAYADHAMYESKRKGKNCYSFFEKEAENNPSNNFFLEFSDEDLFGIEQIDRQHIHLVHLINHINLAIVNIESPQTILGLFDQLLDETILHFKTEEALFKQYNYPGYQAHKEDHQYLLARLPELKAQFFHQDAEQLVLQEIKAWLLNHIKHADKNAIEFVIAHGA